MATRPPHNAFEQKVKEGEKEAIQSTHTEETSWESEERWSSLAATSPCVIMTVTREGTIQFLNRTVGAYAPKDTIGTKVWNYVPPNYRSVMREAIENVFQTGTPTSHEILGPGVEGPASAWYMTHLGPIVRDGTVHAVTMAAIDITAMKKVSTALKESEAQKKAILDASIDRIRLSDTDMRIIWANKTYKRELNIRPEELIGKHCYAVFVKRESPCPECPSMQALTSGTIEHAVLTRPSPGNPEEKAYLDAYAVPLKDEAGNIVNCIQITRNNTERVLAEKELQQSEQRYRTLFEDSKDAVYTITREGTVVSANRSFRELFSIAKDDLPDLNVTHLYVHPTDRNCFQRQVEKKGSVKDFAVKLRKKDGGEMDCLLTSTVWRDSNGTPLGYQGIIRDITKHKRDVHALQAREQEVRRKTMNLKETNIALRVLLKRREDDKRELEEKVLSNVKQLILPYLEKLEKTRLTDPQKIYLDILEEHLQDIISPFVRNLSTTYLTISPTEIKVASLIKQGKTTKEIADCLDSSPRAIEFHRTNLRGKLGLKNKKVNLRSYLLSLP